MNTAYNNTNDDNCTPYNKAEKARTDTMYRTMRRRKRRRRMNGSRGRRRGRVGTSRWCQYGRVMAACEWCGRRVPMQYRPRTSCCYGWRNVSRWRVYSETAYHTFLQLFSSTAEQGISARHCVRDSTLVRRPSQPICCHEPARPRTNQFKTIRHAHKTTTTNTIATAQHRTSQPTLHSTLLLFLSHHSAATFSSNTAALEYTAPPRRLLLANDHGSGGGRVLCN